MAHLLFFLHGIPESAGLIALSLALARVPLRWGIIVPTSVALALVLYVIRSLPFAFGLHTVVLVLLLVVFIAKITSVSPSRSFFAVFSSATTLAVLEYFFLNLFLALTGLEQPAAMANPVLWAVVGLPQAVVIILLGMLVSRCLKPIEIWKSPVAVGPFQKTSLSRRV